jgi:hypothetical protein
MSPRSDTIKSLNISLFAVAGAKVIRPLCILISSLLPGAGGQHRPLHLASHSLALSSHVGLLVRLRLPAPVRPRGGHGAPGWSALGPGGARWHSLLVNRMSSGFSLEIYVSQYIFYHGSKLGKFCSHSHPDNLQVYLEVTMNKPVSEACL